MRIKGIIDEDFVNYKLPAMYIAFPSCTFKCDKENGAQYCINCDLVKEADIEISKEELIERYLSNPITKAIVLAGLEPLDSFLDVLSFVDCLRRQYHCNDPVIVFTGYTEEELTHGQLGGWVTEPNKILADEWKNFLKYGVIIKYGRFRPNQEPHYDEVLGIKLASINQYAKEYKGEYSYQ